MTDETLYERAQHVHCEMEHCRVAEGLIAQLKKGQLPASVETTSDIAAQLSKRTFSRQTLEREQLLATLAAYGVPAEKVRVTSLSCAKVKVLP